MKTSKKPVVLRFRNNEIETNKCQEKHIFFAKVTMLNQCNCDAVKGGKDAEGMVGGSIHKTRLILKIS